MRTDHRLAALGLSLVLGMPGLARAAEADAPAGASASPLPRTAQAVAVLAQSPAYLAALRQIDAERAVSTQFRVGPHEWTGVVSAAQRRQRSPVFEQTQEWDLGLDRTLRLPGKGAAYERAGQARVAVAQAHRRKVWHEQSLRLLEDLGVWVREHEAARVWADQSALLKLQVDAVSRRQALGDAAQVDRLLAEAAWVQARVQSEAAASRAASARESLDRGFPGLDLAASPTLSPPAFSPEVEIDALGARPSGSADLALARLESELADAQLRVEQAESRPDPTVGVRVGQARSGGEQFVGMVFTMPIGGEYRAAGAAAAAARAAAAALHQTDTERRVNNESAQRVRDARSAQALASGHVDAALRLNQVADSLQRSYQLGEGTLGDVVAARRQANEQRLAASLAVVDAWMARQRLALHAGALWPEAQGGSADADGATPFGAAIPGQ
jgi:outer membrane protein TolC